MEKTWYGAIILAYRTDPLRILLVRNTQSGKVTTVSGAVEDGESLKEAAVRELNEEVNWHITQDQLYETGVIHSFVYGANKPERAGDRGENMIFLLNADSLPEPEESADAKEFEWLPLNQGLDEVSFDDLREFLREASKQIPQ